MVEPLHTCLLSLAGRRLTSCIDTLASTSLGVINSAHLDVLNPWVIEGLLDGDALIGVEVHHAVGELHGGRLEVHKDRMARVSSGLRVFAVLLRVLFFPVFDELDVLLEVRVSSFRGVPERTAKDDDHVNLSAGPNIKLPSIVFA